MPDTPQTPVDNEVLIQNIMDGVNQRIGEADKEAFQSSVAFSAGKFEEYYKKIGQDAKERFEEEYEREFGSAPN